jgi:hypothetical protein
LSKKSEKIEKKFFTLGNDGLNTADEGRVRFQWRADFYRFPSPGDFAVFYFQHPSMLNFQYPTGRRTTDEVVFGSAALRRG